MRTIDFFLNNTAVSIEAWAKLREWAVLAGKGRLLLSGSIVLASLKAPVRISDEICHSLHPKRQLARFAGMAWQNVFLRPL